MLQVAGSADPAPPCFGHSRRDESARPPPPPCLTTHIPCLFIDNNLLKVHLVLNTAGTLLAPPICLRCVFPRAASSGIPIPGFGYLSLSLLICYLSLPAAAQERVFLFYSFYSSLKLLTILDMKETKFSREGILAGPLFNAQGTINSNATLLLLLLRGGAAAHHHHQQRRT